MPANDDSLKGASVLVVEDEYLLADDIRQALVEQGGVVLGPVGRVRDALRIAQSPQQIDGAILDVNLSGEMVYPVADVLIARGVPTLFTTGYSESDIPATYAGIAHCEKPVEPAAVVDTLRKLLDQRS